MKAANLNFNLIDSYFGLLKSLSPDSKLELISKLSDSLKGGNIPTNKSLDDLYGSFISKKSADEIIGELKNARNFNRQIEGFWKNIFLTLIFVYTFWKGNTALTRELKKRILKIVLFLR